MSNVQKLSVAVVVGGPQHILQVIDAVGHISVHLIAVIGCLRALVEGGTETVAKGNTKDNIIYMHSDTIGGTPLPNTIAHGAHTCIH